MSGGEMIGRVLELLPAGFGFHPTDQVLIDHYLKPKILRMDSQVDIIPEVDVCKWEPWELPGFSVIKTDDPEWFFFSPLHNKYPNSPQFKRATRAGYWKPTGRDREIKRGATQEVIGTKKTLVFYMGRGPSAVRTGWVIHEYHAVMASLADNGTYVLCRLQRKADENTGSDISTPDEAVAGSGIHQNGPANIMTLGATPLVRLSTSCPQTPLKGAYSKGGGSSSDTDTQVPLVEVKICKGKVFHFPRHSSASHGASSSPPLSCQFAGGQTIVADPFCTYGVPARHPCKGFQSLNLCMHATAKYTYVCFNFFCGMHGDILNSRFLKDTLKQLAMVCTDM